MMVGCQSTLLNSWEGVRVNAICVRASGTVLAADTHRRVRTYELSERHAHSNL